MANLSDDQRPITLLEVAILVLVIALCASRIVKGQDNTPPTTYTTIWPYLTPGVTPTWPGEPTPSQAVLDARTPPPQTITPRPTQTQTPTTAPTWTFTPTFPRPATPTPVPDLKWPARALLAAALAFLARAFMEKP